jgi:glycosyltransferase involved in cell wall biosynthesis
LTQAEINAIAAWVDGGAAEGNPRDLPPAPKYVDGWVNESFMSAQHAAERVFVTTDFTYRDARDYAGLTSRQLRRMPMLVPAFERVFAAGERPEGVPSHVPYFVWTTNLALHKNHENAAMALAIYYDELDGRLDCRVTGVDTDRLLTADVPHAARLRAVRDASRSFRRRVKFMGELPERSYQGLLAGARFLWHAGRIDNGTFSVVEAAHQSVPALSSDYPAMREIASQTQLEMAWMDPHDPEAMAAALKDMEEHADAWRGRLPSHEVLAANRVDRLASRYWAEIRACL